MESHGWTNTHGCGTDDWVATCVFPDAGSVDISPTASINGSFGGVLPSAMAMAISLSLLAISSARQHSASSVASVRRA